MKRRPECRRDHYDDSLLYCLGYALACSGYQAVARSELAEQIAISKERYVSPSNIAMIYNGLDEREQVIAWLQRGIEVHDPRMIFLTVEPKWNNIKGDHRFDDIVRSVGLPQ